MIGFFDSHTQNFSNFSFFQVIFVLAHVWPCWFVVECVRIFSKFKLYFQFSPFKKLLSCFSVNFTITCVFFFFQQQHTRCVFLVGSLVLFSQKEPSWEKKKFFERKGHKTKRFWREKKRERNKKIQKFFELPRIFKGPPKRTWQIYNRSALPGIQPYLQLIWFHGR